MMTLDTIQSSMMLVIGVLAIIILLRILLIVHKQSRRFKELEMRMKAMEKTETPENTKLSDPEEER